MIYVGEHNDILLKPSRSSAQNDLIQLADVKPQSEPEREWRHYRWLLDGERHVHEEVTLDVCTYTYLQVPHTTIHRGSEGGMKQQAQRIIEEIAFGHVADMGLYALQCTALISSRRARQTMATMQDLQTFLSQNQENMYDTLTSWLHRVKSLQHELSLAKP